MTAGFFPVNGLFPRKISDSRSAAETDGVNHRPPVQWVFMGKLFGMRVGTDVAPCGAELAG